MEKDQRFLIAFLEAKTNWAEGQFQQWASEFDNDWEINAYIDIHDTKEIVDKNHWLWEYRHVRPLKLYSIISKKDNKVVVLWGRGNKRVFHKS